MFYKVNNSSKSKLTLLTRDPGYEIKITHKKKRKKKEIVKLKA